MPPADTLIKYKPFLYKQAQLLLSPGHPEVDDLVQEGYIAMWHALDTYDPSSGALPAWLTSKARWRMLEVVQKRSWSGQPSRRDGRNAVAVAAKVLSLDVSRGDGVSLADVLPGDEGVMEDVLAAYHHGEIYQAISELTPSQRKYVHARFWQGMTTNEMKAEIFGYDPSGLWNSAKNGARQKLADRLRMISDEDHTGGRTSRTS